RLLYGKPGRTTYLHWLRSLGVRYVVLPDAALDYSAQNESALLLSGHSGLRIVAQTPHTTIYAVPRPKPLVTGPGKARVVALDHAGLRLRIRAPGRYRLPVHS